VTSIITNGPGLLEFVLISSYLVALAVMGVVHWITFHFITPRDYIVCDGRALNDGNLSTECRAVIDTFSPLSCLVSASSNCVFPQEWEGSWFQSGVPQTIDIQGSTMSNRGSCIASDGDKFLMRE
jgi:hypothetical protein